ncbi:Exonuclease RNase T and DNA polymerase III [mine drainage metagenome]|uniref:Exonuclease RNase T and DNA polymerase III n=1 Tax=mine drainage metagenome TaxID=410659 RepID=T1ALR6_9ZZZZ
MLSIGAAVVHDTKKTFYAELKPLNNNFIENALKVCNLSMEELSKTGKDPVEAMTSLSRWVNEVKGDMKPVFVSFGTFDWMFTKWYLERFGYGNLFGLNGIDMKSYYMGMGSTEWSETTKARMPTAIKPRTKHTHNALHDAIEQAELFENMLRINSERTHKQQSTKAKLRSF